MNANCAVCGTAFGPQARPGAVTGRSKCADALWKMPAIEVSRILEERWASPPTHNEPLKESTTGDQLR